MPGGGRDWRITGVLPLWPPVCLGRNMTETYRTARPEAGPDTPPRHPAHHKCHMEVTNQICSLLHVLPPHSQTKIIEFFILLNFHVGKCLQWKHRTHLHTTQTALIFWWKNIHLNIQTWLDFKLHINI